MIRTIVRADFTESRPAHAKWSGRVVQSAE